MTPEGLATEVARIVHAYDEGNAYAFDELGGMADRYHEAAQKILSSPFIEEAVSQWLAANEEE